MLFSYDSIPTRGETRVGTSQIALRSVDLQQFLAGLAG